MIDGVYAVQLDTALGRKPAVVELRAEGDVVHVALDAPVIGKVTTVASLCGNTFACEGNLKVRLLGKVDYRLTGEVTGDGITCHLDSNKGQLDLAGTRI